MYVITGSVAENEIIAVEILTTPDGFQRIPGFRSEVDGSQREDQLRKFLVQPSLLCRKLPEPLAKVAVILVPFLLLFIYTGMAGRRVHGSGIYEHYPEPCLKPWQVNLLSRAMHGFR